MGQFAEPFAQQSIDLLRRQAVTNRLHPPRIFARQDAVIQSLITDAPIVQLLFRILMAVQAKLGCVGKVCAEFEEEWTEVPIHAVHVEVIDHRGGSHQPGIRGPRFFITPPLRAEHRCLLLGLADEQDAFLSLKLLPVFGCHIVLALTLPEPDHGNVPLFGELFHFRDEGLADWIHQRTGRKLVTAMESEEAGYSPFPLQRRHIYVQVHPVNALNLQADMLSNHFGDTSWDTHWRLRLTPALRDQPPLSGSMNGIARQYPARPEPILGLSDIAQPPDIHLVGLRRSLVSYSYDPWGKMLNPVDPLGSKNALKFSGESLDPTGLYYLRARYYDPAVGAFIS